MIAAGAYTATVVATSGQRYAVQYGRVDAATFTVLLDNDTGERAELWSVEVYPQHRGRGIGRAIVGMASNIARQLGARVLWLRVAKDNRTAIALYASSGFKLVGVREEDYEMEKELAA